MRLINKLPVLALACTIICGCNKLVDIDPPSNKITGDNVFTSDATATGLMTGIYVKMSTAYNTPGMYQGLSADELSLWSGSVSEILVQLYTNSLKINQAAGIPGWNDLYPRIFVLNSVLEALSKSKALTPKVQQQLLGEARFMRAFCYFYLVNYYGDVPLVLTTDYTQNTRLPRVSQTEIYKQIILDLQEAQKLLQDGYVMGDATSQYPAAETERVRPNKWTATALLARVYLYTKDYANAEKEATSIIDRTSLYSLVPLEKVFLKNSTEAIWQLQPVADGWNTNEAMQYVITIGLYNGTPYYVNKFLLDAFEPGDNRKTRWLNTYSDGTTTYHYPFKYQSAQYGAPVTEYTMVFRLAEQFLIRAEARAQQDKLSGAVSDLDAIRLRAGLPETTATTREQLLHAIVHERQVELFLEWGLRWFDLKRLPGFTNPSISLADEIMPAVTTHKGGTWNTNSQWYPIPLEDIMRNPNLVQNAGY